MYVYVSTLKEEVKEKEQERGGDILSILLSGDMKPTSFERRAQTEVKSLLRYLTLQGLLIKCLV